MGLDMFVYQIPKINNNSLEKMYEIANAVSSLEVNTISDFDDHFTPDVTKHIFDENKGQSNWNWFRIIREIGYWRKANAIHQWFVKNVQNGVDECEAHLITKDIIAKLRTDVKTVLDAKDQDMKDESFEVAEATLPTQSGFFFGGTDYDEYYYESLTDTLEICDKLLNDVDFENNYIVYQSSW